jgi:hypothetical protein
VCFRSSMVRSQIIDERKQSRKEDREIPRNTTVLRQTC